jgi:sensor histidine kinase regulating citrate/malate metabolism
VFDPVLENCLENARKKREREPGIAITVELLAGDTPGLAVADTGSAIAEDVLRTLFAAPVVGARTGGLGIGLYQAARLAEEAGFRLFVAQNERGRVRFVLEAIKK